MLKLKREGICEQKEIKEASQIFRLGCFNVLVVKVAAVQSPGH